MERKIQYGASSTGINGKASRRRQAQFTMQYALASTLVPDSLGQSLSVSRWRTEHFQSA
jgi:hypothetical protein